MKRTIYMVEVESGDRWIPMYAPSYTFEDALKKLKSKQYLGSRQYRISRYVFDSVDARTPDWEYATGKEH